MTSCDDRTLMHGQEDPQPVPTCETCGSDNVFYQGGEHCWCWECSDNRVVAKAVAQAVAREVGKP